MPAHVSNLKRTSTGVTVSLRVKPRARRDALELGAGGQLTVAVKAPPVDGKANAAIFAVLAEAWYLPKSAFDIVKGTTSRTKTIAVTGDVATVANRIAGWAESWARENG